MNRPPRWPIGEREHIQQRVSRARRVEQFAKNFLSKAFIPQIAVEPRFILVPRNHWLEQWEKDAIIDFHNQFPLEGYRRLTFMMLDRDIVAVSPSSTYRVLKGAGLLDCWKPKRSLKGTGFVQPLAPHEHWYVDVSYINISGTFFYLCSLLDGCSRSIVHWELREAMTEADVEIILQRGLEKYPHAKPRIISDNGPQFIARDFKEFIRIAGLTHVRTSPYYPQSNGKIERWYKSLKADCIRPGIPVSLQDARRLASGFVEHYNTVRLHSAIGYITPADKLAGKEEAIFAARDQKLLQARETRKTKRNQNNTHSLAATLTFFQLTLSQCNYARNRSRQKRGGHAVECSDNRGGSICFFSGHI